MSFELDFNLDDVQENEYSLIPAGKHRAVVVSVEYVDGYGGEGKDLRVGVSFLDGALKNRRMMAFLPLHNETDWRQAKGRQTLKQLVAVSGIEGFSNYAQLDTGKAIGVHVTHWKNKNTGVVKDQINAFVEAPEESSDPAAASDDVPF